MHNSQQHREQDVRQQVMSSRARDGARKLAPEVRAARTLLAPDVQQQIAQLAEGIEATLLGNQPAQLTRERRWRKGISLWIGIPLAGIISLVVVGSTGWAGAVRYYDIAEKNRLIAEQQGQLAAAERNRREDLEVWQQSVGRVITSHLEAAAELKKTGRYDQALGLIDMFSEIATAVAGQDGELASRLRQERIVTFVSLISAAYGSDVDLSGVRTALQQLTESEIAGRDGPGSTKRD